MEQNTRPAPGSDLEAYGDWVTVDTAVPPASTARPPLPAAADVEIAGELTEAEEEFLGELSDADHAAAPAAASAAAAAAPNAVYPAHNGNGTAESGIGHSEPPGSDPAPAPPAPPAVAPPPTDRPAEAVATGAAGPAYPVARAPSLLPAVPAVPARAPEPAAATPEAAPAARPALEPPDAGTESQPETAVRESGGDALANLERQVASLAADVAEIAARVARLYAGGGSAEAPAAAALRAARVDEAAGETGRVQVSIEEIDSDMPEESAAPPPAGGASPEAGDADSPPVPMIRLVPIPDEHDGQPATTAGAGAGDTAGDAAAASATDQAPGDAGTVPSGDSFRSEVRDVLAYLDQLLDDLPPERVREFAQSPHFAAYKALFAKLGLDD